MNRDHVLHYYEGILYWANGDWEGLLFQKAPGPPEGLLAECARIARNMMPVAEPDQGVLARVILLAETPDDSDGPPESRLRTVWNLVKAAHEARARVLEGRVA